jgi:hypothetical protein
MKITIETEIIQHMTCSACWDDENASEGVACECIERDVRLEVVAEVGLDETKSDYPFGKLSVAAAIDILSIRDMDTRAVWSPGEIADLAKKDLLAIQDALWLRYLESEPRMVLRKDVADLCRSLETHVSLAVESGTDIERIKTMLGRVKRALFDVRQGGKQNGAEA